MTDKRIEELAAELYKEVEGKFLNPYDWEKREPLEPELDKVETSFVVEETTRAFMKAIYTCLFKRMRNKENK